MKDFFEEWEDKYPALLQYTCWRMARKNARSFRDVEGWLRVDQDKLRVVAPGLFEYVCSQVEG